MRRSGRRGGDGRAAAATEVVLVDVDDLDAVIDVVERDRVVRPVELVVVDRALVVAVDELAGAGQGVDLAGVDLVADLLDQEPDVVALGLVEGRAAVLELGDLLPDLALARRVEAGPRGELADDRVEDRHPVALLALHVALEALL